MLKVTESLLGRNNHIADEGLNAAISQLSNFLSSFDEKQNSIT
jgi:hypothetical protein